MGRRRIRKTTLLTVGCAAFLTGLGLARLKLDIPFTAVCLPIVFTALTWRQRSRLALLSIILTCIGLGVLRGQAFLPNTEQYAELHQRKVIIKASVDSDAVYDDKKQLSFDVVNIELLDPYKTQLIGKMKVAGFGENAVYKGDQVVVEGKLFQTRGSRQASITYAQIEIIDRGSAIADKLRRSFSSGLSNVLPDPQAPFGMGLLIGQRTTLGEQTTAALAAVGLTHIIAVSGYNLTIIVRFIHRLFAKKSRYQTVLFSSIIIISFLLMTGLSASIVRASIICGLSLLAWYYGRNIKPLLLILLTAAMTAGYYPVYLWSDIGWYLSFLAFFGILIVAPLITAKFFTKKPKAVTSAVIETFCAQIMTLPLVLYIFNETSSVALVSNALIVPLVPLAMLFTLVSGIVGMINPEVLYIFALPARLLLTYILDLAKLLSGLPRSLLSISMSVFVMVWSYILIIFLVVVLWQKTRGRHVIITDIIDR